MNLSPHLRPPLRIWKALLIQAHPRWNVEHRESQQTKLLSLIQYNYQCSKNIGD